MVHLPRHRDPGFTGVGGVVQHARERGADVVAGQVDGAGAGRLIRVAHRRVQRRLDRVDLAEDHVHLRRTGVGLVAEHALEAAVDVVPVGAAGGQRGLGKGGDQGGGEDSGFHDRSP